MVKFSRLKHRLCSELDDPVKNPDIQIQSLSRRIAPKPKLAVITVLAMCISAEIDELIPA